MDELPDVRALLIDLTHEVNRVADELDEGGKQLRESLYQIFQSVQHEWACHRALMRAHLRVRLAADFYVLAYTERARSPEEKKNKMQKCLAFADELLSQASVGPKGQWVDAPDLDDFNDRR